MRKAEKKYDIVRNIGIDSWMYLLISLLIFLFNSLLFIIPLNLIIHRFDSIGFCSDMQQLKHIKIEFELNELNWTEWKRERRKEAERCVSTLRSLLCWGLVQGRARAVNAVEWQAGIRGEVVPLKSKLIQGAELTLEHSQLTRPASPAAVLQRLFPSPSLSSRDRGGGVEGVALVH